MGANVIGKTFWESGWDWSKFMWEHAGLVKPSVKRDGIGETLCGAEWDWSS